MSYSGGWRPHIESALRLNLHRLFESGALRAGADVSSVLRWMDCDGAEVACVGFRSSLGDVEGRLTLSYCCSDRDTGERNVVECPIQLVTVPCNYGGRRWFFLCPYTHRRALKLYKWDGIDLFCHREAIRPKPTYASERVSGIDRIVSKRWMLRRKLGDDVSDLFMSPLKPKWMREKTYRRYMEKDADLAAQEAPFLEHLLNRLR